MWALFWEKMLFNLSLFYITLSHLFPKEMLISLWENIAFKKNVR